MIGRIQGRVLCRFDPVGQPIYLFSERSARLFDIAPDFLQILVHSGLSFPAGYEKTLFAGFYYKISEEGRAV
jgi:hypothetical protein